jgi:hypothetical protein
MTVTAEAANIVAIRSPTMMSGHPDPVSAHDSTGDQHGSVACQRR